MSVPEHLWRFPTAEAIAGLAQRFHLPNSPDMQDWELEVADPSKIDEFWDAYSGGELTDDEMFVLMETLIQSFEDLPGGPEADARWAKVLAALDRGIERHIYTVWSWSCVDDEDPKAHFRATASLRGVLARHRHRFERR